MENIDVIQMPLIGDDAPAFDALTSEGEIHFPKDYKGKWVVLFSHPSDFTPVCTTEFMTFASMTDDFSKLNTELIGLSIDSNASHIAWARKIKEFEWKNIKHPDIKFPIIADLNMNVAKKYGMIQPNQSTTQAVRAVFFIDPKGKIRTILYYPMSIGRNFDEIKRIIIALQKSDTDGVALPADWRPGDDVIVPLPGTTADAEKRLDEQNENQYSLDWFLTFRKDK